MSKVCEACQLKKQVKHPFPTQTIHVSCKPLEMIHSDVDHEDKIHWRMQVLREFH
jgi:hypothetical protein